MAKGKRFERRIMLGLRSLKGWAHRLMDTAGGMHIRFSQQSPFDFLYLGEEVNLAIEAKETKANSISFDRLAPHQKEHLLKFQKALSRNHAFVAVNFHNMDKKRDIAFMCPIKYWDYLENKLGRKSVPLSYFIKGNVPQLKKMKYTVEVKEKGQIAQKNKTGWGGFLGCLPKKEGQNGKKEGK